MLCCVQAKGVKQEYPDWALAMAALLAVSSLVTLGLSTFSDQWEGAMVVGEAGEQQRLQGRAGERVGWETPW